MREEPVDPPSAEIKCEEDWTPDQMKIAALAAKLEKLERLAEVMEQHVSRLEIKFAELRQGIEEAKREFQEGYGGHVSASGNPI